MNSIGFPNLGLGPFSVFPTALSIGPLRVQWYGIFIVCGMILGTLYAYGKIKKTTRLTLDDLLNVVIVCILCGIVGARAYYVLTTLDVYEYRSFYDVIAVWNGGLAILGGILAGVIGLIVLCAVKKYPLLAVIDCLIPGVLIGQTLGRWGNFTNAEAYGVLDRFEFLGHIFPLSGQVTGNPFIMTINGTFVQPTFLYESVWNAVGLLLVHLFFPRKRYDGQILLLYCVWYGFGRALIEGLRGDSLYVGQFRISQLLSVAAFVIGIILLIVFSKTKHTTIKEN